MMSAYFISLVLATLTSTADAFMNLQREELQHRREGAAQNAVAEQMKKVEGLKKQNSAAPGVSAPGKVAQGTGSKCENRNCTCRDDFSSAVTFLKHRLEVQAKAPGHAWKQLTQLDETHPLIWKAVWFINADENTKRADDMKTQLNRQLQNFGMHAQRWPVTTVDEAEWINKTEFSSEGKPVAEYVEAMSPDTYRETLAVYYSHVNLLKKIHKEDPNGEGLYVILEDDVTLEENWKDEIEKLFKQNQVPKDWDILKFGYWGATRCQDFVTDKVVEQLPPMLSADNRESFYSGMLGYIVRPKSIPSILEQLHESQIMGIDGALLSFGQEAEYQDQWGRTGYVSWGAHTYATYVPFAYSNLVHRFGAGLRERLNLHDRHLVQSDLAPKEM